MNRLTAAKLALVASLGAMTLAGTPALAQQDMAAQYFRERQVTNKVPQVLSGGDREYYRDFWRALDEQDWTKVEAMLADRPTGPLHAAARAEFYLHANSPTIELPRLQAWLAEGRELPQAEQIANLAQKRGMLSQAYLPPEQQLVRQPYATKRTRPRAVNDGTMPRSVRSAILQHIKDDDPDGARVLLDGVDGGLSSEARAEWRQRVAWSYYIENNDASALAIARTVREGSGAWVAEGDWVYGLAAWRLGDCESAADGFDRAARGARNPELTAAAYYWTSRALVRCREPDKAAEKLRGAANYSETLYGMLAREQLGQALPDAGSTPDFTAQDWQRLSGSANVRSAVALAEIGREGLADRVLRHEARIGAAQNYDALGRLARELGLPSTQLWMAHNAPQGGRPEPSLRFPAPKWAPINGWRVSPALAFAHALQESNFRASVVSPAGARGLMQIMPAAARDHSGTLGVSGNARNLNRPEINLAFGQQHLEMLRDSGGTQGLLPKIMAAYNAGLTPITRWNSEIRDQDDPLLYMESIPYWETRGYVAIVMRNYWMYERQAGAGSQSREALAQGMWPTFPGVRGGGVRLTRNQ